ncbi:hypothetical protein GGR53DRAFT_198101 [Hypoxylon sp. FL1150]|nr:hypothetical protein GGR53DRAFT_198101 [Hypoxylon sp. FL1150]
MGATPNTLTPDATAEQIASVPLPSLTTSATHLRASDIESSDRDSIFSKRSRVSTVMNLNGERLEWPSPPTQIPMIGHFFTCPYCKVICPRRYLDRSSWQVHLIHDLQPYHCTYEDCTDPNRLYGTRKEWLDHENQHTQVWHCQEHTDELEFETLTEYVEHLKISHPDAPTERYSQELIRTMVAPSRKLRRECPFCPFLPNSSPDRVTEMQKHITFHLERLALLALPLVDDDSDGLDCSLNSPEIQRFGRKSSIAADFSEEERISFADFMYIEETQEGDHPVSDDNIREITLMDDNFRVQHWLPEDDSLFDDPPNQEIVPLEEFPIEYKEANGSTRPREKRLGLDDLERVRIIRDRGESDFYRAYSHVSQQSDIHTPLPGDVDTLLETMLQELEESKVMCALDPTKYYLPRRRLPEILTTQRVRTIVELPCFRDYPDKDDLTKNICLGPSPCLKLLAVLIITSKAHDLPRHMKEGLTDKCLPMDSKSSMYCRYHRNLHSTVNTYHTPTVQEFSRWSYSLVAPYIKNNTVKHPHYILRHDDVFPMEVFGQQMSDTGPTIPLDEGFDQVYQVKIDSSHYDFGAFGVHHHSGLFALKGLFSSDRENFSQELAALLFSMDNAHEQDAMDHLTQPLATFEVLDPRTRHTTYYFLFDWADGNLRDFWRTNQYLVGDMRHSLWMSQQFHKICLALQCLHNERETSAGIAPTDQLYGRHGEIKPDNIVWFHLEHSSSDHFLALSDFGSAHLDTQMSRSYQDARRSAHTITYSAPESNLSDGAISYATDIFSLGCVFLEYVTWVLCGLDSVENQFPNYRLEGDASGFITDKFFAIQSDVNGVQRPLLKPQVRNWISRLQQHANCSWYLYQLLEIIRDKMLEPDREKRVHILPLIEEMQKLRMACELNDSFYLKTRYS